MDIGSSLHSDWIDLHLRDDVLVRTAASIRVAGKGTDPEWTVPSGAESTTGVLCPSGAGGCNAVAIMVRAGMGGAVRHGGTSDGSDRGGAFAGSIR